MLKPKTIAYLQKHCHRLDGKTIIVTGASSGIGLKATEQLAWLGAHVIMACRNLTKAQKVFQSIVQDNPAASLELRCLDIGDRASIRSFAQAIADEKTDIHALVNNAGVFRVRGTTKDGEELVMGTNYHGTRALTEAMLPYLRSLPHEVSITFTSSISYRIADPSKDLSDAKDSVLTDVRRYFLSKLLITRYGLELHRDLSGTNLRIIITQPGISATPIATKALGAGLEKIVALLASLVIQSPEKSALAIPYVLSNEVEPGALYGPHGFLDGWGYPQKNRLTRKALPQR